MDNVIAASINTFPVSPFATVPASLLQSLQDGLRELQDEVETLRATVTRQDEKIVALEQWHGTLSDNQYTQLQIINQIREDAPKEPRARAITKKSTSHIDQLHKLMLEEKSQQVSIVKGARLLGISKERMRLLKPLILKDGRFELSWSTIKGKKAVVIRIRKFL